MPIMLLNLINLLFSNYAEKIFSTQKNISFSMCAHALNGGPQMFSHREGF